MQNQAYARRENQSLPNFPPCQRVHYVVGTADGFAIHSSQPLSTMLSCRAEAGKIKIPSA